MKDSEKLGGFTWHMFALGNLERVSISVIIITFLGSWSVDYLLSMATIVQDSGSWAGLFRWWVNDWSVRKELFWPELGIGSSVRTVPPDFYRAPEDRDQWELKGGCQEDLTDGI